MKPKAVVFDLGKVLVEFDWAIAARRMAPRCAMAPAELLRVFDYSPLVVQFELGTVSPEQFFAEAGRMVGFQGAFAEFGEIFADIFTEITAMTALHAELRRRGVPTFIFSNTNELAVAHIRRHFPFFAQFDGYVLSYEHGAMKPHAPLYEVVERMTGRRGAELLYIDDRLENVEAGRARGWNAVQQVEPGKTIAAVRALGLLG
ncbi:MAG TPA: HAD family phosphatase [Verrucomicrobiae bacterium]|nr:HAD family phosphatase [Verrucomicrobiae bacterium]